MTESTIAKNLTGISPGCGSYQHGARHMIEYIDRPPAGWFVVDVMRRGGGPPFRPGRPRNDWAALMMDVDPDEFIARRANASGSCWVRIPGKHKSRDAAWDALEAMMATRH